MLALEVYRAATQSITHDEARVFLLYLQGSVRHAFTYTGIQNHVLQAFLSRLMLVVFPASAFTIRIPTLAAAAIYCGAAIRISERLLKDRWMRLASVALLTLNPYTLDFLSAARGYGLVLAFMLVAISLLVPGDASMPKRGAVVMAGASLGLAAAATTASLFAVAGIVFAFAAAHAMSRQWRDGVVQTVSLTLVATVVAVVPLANQLYKATRGDYGTAIALGGTSLPLEAASLVRASVSRGNPYLTTLSALTAVQAVACVALSGVLLAIVAAGVVRLLRWTSLPPGDRAPAWMFLVLAGTAIATIAAHVLAGVTYPQGRMALYWIPLVTLAAMLALSCTRAGSISRAAGWIVVVLVLAVDVSLLQVTTYADWESDASDRMLVDRLVDDHHGSVRQVTVGGSWILEPSINFYRVTRRLDWLTPMVRRNPVSGDDYYVLIREDREAVDRLGLRVIVDDPRTGTLLAVAP